MRRIMLPVARGRGFPPAVFTDTAGGVSPALQSLDSSRVIGFPFTRHEVGGRAGLAGGIKFPPVMD